VARRCNHVAMTPFTPSRHRRPVVIADWQDAEEFAEWHMRGLGFPDAKVTGSGADEGLDVTAQNAAAQVKHRAGATGAPDVQRLVGAAAAGHSYRLFYSLSGLIRSEGVVAV